MVVKHAPKFRSAKRDCKGCGLREPSFTARMRQKSDSEQGRYTYSRRLGIVEPVFADIASADRLRRFQPAGRTKVNTQSQLFCLVHNIGKIHRYRRPQRAKRNVH